MRYQTISVKAREGKASAGQMKNSRAEGAVPAVLSRRGEEAMSLQVTATELQKAVHKAGVGSIMELVEDNGTKHLGMLKELQWHPISRKLHHASFQEVKRDQVVNTTIPLVFVGEPVAIKEKTGQLLKNNESVEVHGKVDKLPDHITIDISELVIGDVITAGSIAYPEGITAQHPDSVIISLTPPTVISIETPTAETDAVGAIKEATPAETTEGTK